MAAKSQTLDNNVLNAALRNIAYTGPATVYAALYTTAPTPTTSGTEVVDTNYARQAVTFSAASAGSTSNSGVLNFFGAGAAAGPYTILAVAICDASTAGNVLYFGNLATSKTVNTGDTLSFAIAALAISES